MVVVNTTNHSGPDAHLVDALAAADPSCRLQAALAAGTHPDPDLIETLVDRCAVEPDFFVRDMLTWALCRLPTASTVPRLVRELGSDSAQARSESLHTLSKIGDRLAWPAVSALLHDEHDEVTSTAWRAAVALVPPGDEAALAAELATELGQGDEHTQLSLSRALVGLGEAVLPVLDTAGMSPDPRIRAHAAATQQLCSDPDSGFTRSLELAKRVAVAGPDL
ncbi:HEAT repeat domain-containing protein [Rhodococcus tibetensis]|uniref:HEAT repeat domain-containing protein n=1 Tax=Rhodococcus tibetensis TaxID=2965064 RepID=A0ABT1QBB4_9NOCA|nr:HEAT repeat domain-containing protein [Rhodococcus sp. FXJ9.536]MCQ4118422.1 HEAT repeat domain-containing protein [Rhodococcus sp. FXJ9.536]